MSASGDGGDTPFRTSTSVGPGIAWTRFARFAVAFIVTTIFGSIAEFVGGVFDAFLIDPLTGVANFAGQLITAFFGPALSGQLAGYAAPLVSFVQDLGLLGFPVAIVLVLSILWVVQNIRKVIL